MAIDKIMEKGSVSYAEDGPNPHFKPEIQRWNHIEILSPEGLEFGIVMDEVGFLSIGVRLPGGEWPEGFTPKKSEVIKPGEVAWAVQSDERGPAVGHEFQADPEDASQCLICKASKTT